MNTLYCFDITLTLQGPILTKATTPASFGLDAAVARDFTTGRPMLPGTLVEGKVRESLFQLGEIERLEELFGKETKEASGNEPERGRLLIGDLIAKNSPSDEAKPVPTLSRTALDSTLGSAKGESLRVIETPFLAGDKVVFEGKATCFCADDEGAKEIAGLLRAGLLWLVQAGANRTTGFGRVLGASVESSKVESDPTTVGDAPVALDLEITPLGPLCIAKHKIGDNLFESDTVIPGNMLAGAIMQTAAEMGIAGELKDDFHKIRFRHAFPTTAEKPRPRVLPLSTVKVGAIDYDVSGQREPVLLKDESGVPVAPQFPIDWKEHGDALSNLDWAFPVRELRVRTAIDSTSRTADRGEEGAAGKLFAWEMVHPLCDDRKTPVLWRTRIDLSGVKNPVATANVLAKVLAQLSFVSKTKVRCKVGITAVTEPETVTINSEKISLVLQSHAQLVDPRFQEVAGVPQSGALSATDLFKLYAAVWEELSGGSLKLSHHFAQQHLAGGNYLAIRFQKKKGRKAYDPWLLTNAGSVFVFTVHDEEKAKKKMEAWSVGGLPLPEWAKKEFGDQWFENPYRPENGFGEIAVHRTEFATPETHSFELADSILTA